MKEFSCCDVPLTICILVVSILILPAGAYAENTMDQEKINGPVLLWSVPNGDRNYASGSMKNIACPGDGSIVIAGYSRGIVGARDREGNPLWNWHAPESGAHVWSVESSRQGKYTGAVLDYAGTERNEEFVYLDAYGNTLWSRTIHKPGWGISQSENGKIVAIPGPGNISYFDETGKQAGISIINGFSRLTATSDNGSTTAVNVPGSSGHGGLLLTGPGGTIAWNVPADTAVNLAISGDGRYILLQEANQIREFSSDGRELWTYPSSQRFTDGSVSNDGSVVAGSQHYLRFFTRTGDLLSEYKPPSSASQPDPWISDVSMSENGKYVSAAMTPDVLFFDRNGTLLWRNPGTSFIYSTCMSSDGKYLGVATQGDFRYYDTGIASPDGNPAAGPNATLPTRADIPAGTTIIATCALIILTRMKK